MADQPLRIYKAGAEFVADAAERIGLTKQTLDALASQEGEAPIQVYKFGAEVIYKVPPRAKFTRQAIDVLASQEGEASIQLYKFGAEFIYKRPSAMNFTRQAIDVLASGEGEAGIQVYKFGAEFICRASPILEEILPTPSYWIVFAKNWASTLEIETEYKTDITKSASKLTEDRRSLANKPIRSVKIKWTALKRDSINELAVTLRKLSNARMFIPIYSDQMHLTQDAAGPDSELYCTPGKMRIFVNQRIAILTLGEDLLPTGTVYLREVKDIEIDHIIIKTTLPFETFKAGKTIILPLLDTEPILDPNLNNVTDLVADVELNFLEVAGKSALPPTWTGLPEEAPIYNGYPIFNFEPNWKIPPKLTYMREGKIENLGRGVVVFVEGDRYKLVQNFEMSLDRDEFFNYLRFFDSRRGRQQAFWMIDLDQIWKFVAISGVDNKFIDIEVIGDFTYFNEDLEYIGIVTKDGSYYVREVVTAQDLTNFYRITITEALPEIQAIDIVRVTRARLSRFKSDVSKEIWTTNTYATIKTRIIEVLEEKNVEM